MIKKLFNLILCFIIFSGFLTTGSFTHASVCTTQSQCNQMIQDTQKAANDNQQKVNNAQDVVNGLNAQVTATQSEIDLTSQQINLTSNQIDDTQAQIEQKQKDLDQKKVDLNKTIVNYYETGTPSTVEIIASASSLSDVINQSQYTEALSGQMNDQANQIIQTKNALQTASDNLKKQKSDLDSQASSLADKKRNLDIQNAQKNKLLSQANSTQSQLQATLEQAKKDKNAIPASSVYYGGDTKNISSGGSGGYPYAGSTPDVPDAWGFYTRECTSYAAWWFNAHGKAWYNTEPGSGSAWNWPALAADQGYSVSSTPREGAIVSWSNATFSPYGHVAIVQKVYSDGSYDVSQYNWVKYSYSEMHVTGSLAAAGRFIY